MSTHPPASGDARPVASSTHQPNADAVATRPLLPLFGDMRSHKRMQLALSGHVACATGAPAPCVTRDISEGGAALESAQELAIGDALNVRLDDLGELEAEVKRIFPGGFAVTFRLGPERAAEITERLGALWRRSPLSLIEVSLDGGETTAAVI